MDFKFQIKEDAKDHLFDFLVLRLVDGYKWRLVLQRYSILR